MNSIVVLSIFRESTELDNIVCLDGKKIQMSDFLRSPSWALQLVQSNCFQTIQGPARINLVISVLTLIRCSSYTRLLKWKFSKWFGIPIFVVNYSNHSQTAGFTKKDQNKIKDIERRHFIFALYAVMSPRIKHLNDTAIISLLLFLAA